jgi:hypothetical protein
MRVLRSSRGAVRTFGDWTGRFGGGGVRDFPGKAGAMVASAWRADAPYSSGPPPTIGGDMGFLDRLLGRSKDTAEEAMTKTEEMAKDTGQKAETMGESGAERAEDMARDVKTEVEEHTPGRDNP